MAKTHQLLVSVPGNNGTAIWDIKCSFHSLIVLLIVSLVAGVVYLSGESGRFLFEDNSNSNSSSDNNLAIGSHENDDLVSSSDKCNLFSGKWVFDNKSYPLYKEQDCKFMSDQLACQKFGRKDLDYQHWRWQPHQCDIPRFFFFFFNTILPLFSFFPISTENETFPLICGARILGNTPY